MNGLVEEIMDGYRGNTLVMSEDKNMAYCLDFERSLDSETVCHQYNLNLVAGVKDGKTVPAKDFPEEEQQKSIVCYPFKESLREALESQGFYLVEKDSKEQDSMRQGEKNMTGDPTLKEAVVPDLVDLLKKNFRLKGYLVRETMEEDTRDFTVCHEDETLVATLVAEGQGYILNQKNHRFEDEQYKVRRIIEETMEEDRVVRAALGRNVEMKYEGLPVGWKQITAFASILMGLKITKYGLEYATWREDSDGKGVSSGRYTDNLQSAKEDFAIRSGMVRAENLFTETQLKIILDGLVQFGQTDALTDGIITEDERAQYTKIIEEIRSRFPDIEIALEQEAERTAEFLDRNAKSAFGRSREKIAE